MNRLMLDTSSYSAFKRGHPGAIHAIQAAARLLVPSIALGELLAGFEIGSRREANRRELEEFLESPRVVRVSIGPATAERYAVILASLRKAGRPIPTNDLWIAACSMEQAAELLTLDAHYLHVSQILVRHLPSESEAEH